MQRKSLSPNSKEATGADMFKGIKLEILGFGALPVQRRTMAMRAIVEACVAIDWQYIIESGPHGLPSIPAFHEKRPFKLIENDDVWRNIPSVIEKQEGSTMDFMCWRIAELRNQGYDDVYPHIKYIADPENKWGGSFKMGVRREDVIEDMATLLGVSNN